MQTPCRSFPNTVTDYKLHSNLTSLSSQRQPNYTIARNQFSMLTSYPLLRELHDKAPCIQITSRRNGMAERDGRPYFQ